MSSTLLVRGIQSNPSGPGAFNARGGADGDVMVSELHGRYYQTTADGRVFSVCTQGTGVTTTAALATTFTGLAIGNPANSGYNLVLVSFTCSQFAVGAAATIGIMGGAGSITASLTPQSRIIGSGLLSLAGVTATAGQTISTPVLIESFGSVGSVATTSIPLVPGLRVFFDGDTIIPPGSFAASYTAIVTTSALQFSFTWEEVPIIR
jgi:hypothetical protein